jgi:uncharacterized membrane protein (UPF0127 family)
MAHIQTHLKAFLVFLVFTLFPACEAKEAAKPTNSTSMAKSQAAIKTEVEELSEKNSFEVCGQKFLLEVARSSRDRNRGLMFRPSLEADRGMIFVFRQPAIQTFWMKNVAIPLDILFFDAQGRLLNSMTMQPESPLLQDIFLKQYRSIGKAQFVVELPEGTLNLLSQKQALRNCKLSPLPEINDQVDP